MMKFCSLYSGSNGNSIFISDFGSRILVDAGLSGKLIDNLLFEIDEKPESLNGILVTHEHLDHIIGAGVLSRRYNLPIYANKLTWDGMKKNIGNIDEKNIRFFENNKEFCIGDIIIKAFPISHDANDPVGFRLKVSNKEIAIATDIGKMTRSILSSIEKTDILLLESNHDKDMLKLSKYPYKLKRRIMSDKGHLSNDMAGKVVAYLAEQGMTRFILGHLSEKSNFPELVYQTVKNILKEKEIKIEEDIDLTISERNRLGSIVTL